VVTDTIACKGTVVVPPKWGPWSSWTKGDCANGKRKYSRWRSCTPNGQKCKHSKTGALVTSEDEHKTVTDASCNVASCTVVPSIGTALPPANVVQAEFKKKSGGYFHKMYLPQTGTQLTQAAYSQWKQFIKFEKCSFPGGKVEWRVKDYTSPVRTCEAFGSYGYRGNNSKYTIPCLMDKTGKCTKTWLDGKDHGYSSCMQRVHNGGGLPATARDQIVNGKKLRFCATDASCSVTASCTGTWGSWTAYGCNKKGYKAKWRKCPAGKTCYDAVKKQCTTSMDEHSTTEKCNNFACGPKKHSSTLLSVEAECSSKRIVRNGHAWTNRNSAGASGGVALEGGPDRGNAVNYPEISGSPEVQYRLDFPSAGRYYVWVRGWGDADGSGQRSNRNNTNGEGKKDSVHVGIGGRASTAKQMDHFPRNKWFWSNDRRGTSSKAYIDVPSAGLHTVSVWMREDGFIYDKLVFTKTGYKPSGTGPN